MCLHARGKFTHKRSKGGNSQASEYSLLNHRIPYVVVIRKKNHLVGFRFQDENN